ncbi:T9SS type A sorting domain-containing protein [Bacteroidota bacterium]
MSLHKVVSIEEDLSSIPNVFNLEQNYPNPFNESATITFPNQSNEKYSLVITDLSGKIFRIVEGITTSEYVLKKGDLIT